MKNLFLTSIFCIFAFLNPTEAQETSADENKPLAEDGLTPQVDVCAKFNDIRPQLKLRSSYGKLVYNYDYDRENLNIIAEKNNQREEGMFTAGLALASFDMFISISTVSRSVNGRICIIPASVEVFFGYQNPTIYISNDLDQDSCIHKVVLRHEQQHLQINASILDHYLPFMKQKFTEALRVLKAREAIDERDENRIIEDMKIEYADLMLPWAKRFKITTQLEQQRLDNREHYEYESRLCQ